MNRVRQVDYADFFSPAEREYTSYLVRNRRSLMGATEPSVHARLSTRGAGYGADQDGEPAPARGRPASTGATGPGGKISGGSPQVAARAFLPKAEFVGGKVVQGRGGPMRTYRLGSAAFLVRSGETEDDVVQGVNYLALRANTDVGFATDPAGRGLVMLDSYGRVMRHRGAPVRYTWDELQELGKQAIIPREKWTAQQKWGSVTPQNRPYSMITLHHTGRRDTPQAVLDLHSNNISGPEKWGRYVGRKLGVAQTYEDYGDIGYHFLIDESGRIYEGRPLDAQGAHVSGHNPGNLGIAVLGDYSSRPLNAAQMKALDLLITTLGPRLGIAPDVRGGGVANSKPTSRARVSRSGRGRPVRARPAPLNS